MSTILSSKTVKTRTSHMCFGCGRKFPSNTPMRRDGIADGGRMHTYYLCETCVEITSEMNYGDEFSFSELQEAALEKEEQK